jgi:soluble lytic murein transglycosylase-like protein
LKPSSTLAGLALGLLAMTGASSADTLFLRSGASLKIDTLSCQSTSCLASVPGGRIELRAVDVLSVEPDEWVETERAPDSSDRAKASENPSSVPGIEELVALTARKYGLPPSLVRAVAQAESALNPFALSPKGAQGVMQLMPGTARELGVLNAFDPAENIDAGGRLLRQLLEKYEGRIADALAAYNAGPGALARHEGIPPYRETRRYIRAVVRDYQKAERAGAARGTPREK